MPSTKILRGSLPSTRWIVSLAGERWRAARRFSVTSSQVAPGADGRALPGKSQLAWAKFRAEKK